MLIALKPNTTKENIDELLSWISIQELKAQRIDGIYQTVLGIIGDTTRLDIEQIKGLSYVESVQTITEPFRYSSRKTHTSDTILSVGDVKIGGNSFALIAGPCSIESKEQLFDVAEQVKKFGANILRGGAYKPRTSPYDFQGLKEEGIALLSEAKKKTGLPIITEIMSASHLAYFDDVDIIQVGARNMQNYDLLSELGKIRKPILLKRGLSCTLKELLMSAEYILAGGNSQVILCERGIRTFETFTRNTLDISAIPMLKEMTHLPVLVDPSHASGRASLVEPLTLAAVAAGADGVMIEVHNNPGCALCDGPQSLTPEEFSRVSTKITALRQAL